MQLAWMHRMLLKARFLAMSRSMGLAIEITMGLGMNLSMDLGMNLGMCLGMNLGICLGMGWTSRLLTAILAKFKTFSKGKLIV
mmetsp:Transcript_33693/g.54265  ORF Transcript_33693/g.54265 Transcript_33693/m.54265 type:complete len:83 (-) Transcript_33693:134-382(-)